MGAPHPRHPGPQGRDLAVGDPGPDGSGLAVAGRIEASLAAGGFKLTRDSVAGRQAVIGRRSALSPPTWAIRCRQGDAERPRSALRLHTFVLVAVFKADATPDHLDRFLEESAQYARVVKGGVGTTWAVAVAVVDTGSDRAGSAAGWAIGPPGHRTAARAYPVLVDVASQRVTAPEGAGYPQQLTQLVREHVVPALAPAQSRRA